MAYNCYKHKKLAFILLSTCLSFGYSSGMPWLFFHRQIYLWLTITLGQEIHWVCCLTIQDVKWFSVHSQLLSASVHTLSSDLIKFNIHIHIDFNGRRIRLILRYWNSIAYTVSMIRSSAIIFPCSPQLWHLSFSAYKWTALQCKHFRKFMHLLLLATQEKAVVYWKLDRPTSFYSLYYKCSPFSFIKGLN